MTRPAEVILLHRAECSRSEYLLEPFIEPVTLHGAHMLCAGAMTVLAANSGHSARLIELPSVRGLNSMAGKARSRFFRGKRTPERFLYTLARLVGLPRSLVQRFNLVEVCAMSLVQRPARFDNVRLSHIVRAHGPKQLALHCIAAACNDILAAMRFTANAGLEG